VTAVSKKDRKNRSRKDESVKVDKNVSNQNESVKPANSTTRYTSKFVKSNKKVGPRCILNVKCNCVQQASFVVYAYFCCLEALANVALNRIVFEFSLGMFQQLLWWSLVL
jgi:hypothetical protein